MCLSEERAKTASAAIFGLVVLLSQQANLDFTFGENENRYTYISTYIKGRSTENKLLEFSSKLGWDKRPL